MRNTTLLISSLILIVAFIASPVFAQNLEHGNQAMQIFDKEGFENSPLWVQIWVGFMSISFLTGLFFVKNHAAARWVVGGMLSGVVTGQLMSMIFAIPNYSGYIALIHLIFWSPALYYLLRHRPFLGNRSPFTIWSAVITFVICFSFIFDIRDAAIYLSHAL